MPCTCALSLAGVGKSSLVHLIVNGRPTATPPRTIGCSVAIKYLEYSATTGRSGGGGGGGGAAASWRGDTPCRGFFVELWDVAGHEQYRECRSLFYSQINGVIFVYDLTRGNSRKILKRWLAELGRLGSFSAPSNRPPAALHNGGGSRSNDVGEPSIPVPLLVIGNKADIENKDPVRKTLQHSKKKVLEVARQFAEKHRLVQAAAHNGMPTYVKPTSGLSASAKLGLLDADALDAFFCQLIQRRYFMEEVPAVASPSMWSPSRTLSLDDYLPSPLGQASGLKPTLSLGSFSEADSADLADVDQSSQLGEVAVCDGLPDGVNVAAPPILPPSASLLASLKVRAQGGEVTLPSHVAVSMPAAYASRDFQLSPPRTVQHRAAGGGKSLFSE
eukprot:SM000043S15827  [mRNA]  locus=s43:388736:390958:+ [translate_table: standard]